MCVSRRELQNNYMRGHPYQFLVLQMLNFVLVPGPDQLRL